MGFDLTQHRKRLWIILGVLHREANIWCLTDRQMALQTIHFSLPDMADIYTPTQTHTHARAYPHTPLS